MKFYETDHCTYYVTAKIGNKEMRIAEINPPLFGNKLIYVHMHFPYEDASMHILKYEYMDHKEMLEEAKKIICKRMYLMQQSMYEEMQTIEFDDDMDENCKRKRTLQHGNVRGWTD